MARKPLLGVLGTLALVAACTGAPAATPTAAPTDAPTPTAEPTQAGPDKLVIGFVPSREAAALVETIQPIADYLSEQLGIPVEGYVSTDYTGLVTAMETGQAQIGAFGPFAMIQAVDRAGAEVILQSQRNGSGTYHTQFFTNDPETYCAEAPVENERTVDDAPVMYLNCNGTERGANDTPKGPIGIDAVQSIPAGTTVSFVEETSASGYIFPATVLINEGIDIVSGIEKLFAGGHDASIIAVCEGQATVGVSFDDARTVAASDCDIASNVVVFAYGSEIPNDGVVVSGDLPDELKMRIKQALLDYAATDAGKDVLGQVYNITAFAEPDLDALEIVRDAAEALPQ